MPLPVFCGIHNSLDWKWARAFGRQSDIACFFLEHTDVVECDIQQCLGNLAERVERVWISYHWCVVAGIGDSCHFHYCSGNGASIK